MTLKINPNMKISKMRMAQKEDDLKKEDNPKNEYEDDRKHDNNPETNITQNMNKTDIKIHKNNA